VRNIALIRIICIFAADLKWIYEEWKARNIFSGVLTANKNQFDNKKNRQIFKFVGQ
jgi:hypothetical protein